MSRIKSWILAGCAASSLFAVAASTPPEPSRFSVTITPVIGAPAGVEASGRTDHGVPIAPFSVYQPEALSTPRDAIAAAGEAP